MRKIASTRFRSVAFALVAAAFIFGSVSLPAMAAGTKQYRVVLADRQGHHGVETVCAVGVRAARDKAMAEWGHVGHHRFVVSIRVTGRCQ